MVKILISFTLATTLVLIFSILYAKSTDAKVGHFEYLILSMQWAAAYCKTHVCEKPHRSNFTINALWGMYKPLWWVPPYNNQSGCTEITPLPSNYITRGNLSQIVDRLDASWPNVAYVDDPWRNQEFWQLQWVEDAMCFDFPDEHSHYFTVGLNMADKYNNILALLNNAGIFYSDTKPYPIYRFIHAINDILKKRSMIYCDIDNDGIMQLREVWLCFDVDYELISCPWQTFECARDHATKIHFPAPVLA